MATTKITDLTAYTDPVNTDVLPIVDVTSDVTKKVSIANVMKNASLGSNSAPGIAFDGDPNTGIYSPGADQVAVTTGGTQRLLIDSSGAVTIAGDLTVNGTTTNINTTNLVIEDKNIILGDVTTPTDVTADGGGITLKGTTDKTLNWVDSTDAWTSSEHINLASGKNFYINGTEVLSSTALGSGVLITSSNITDGTIVNADINASAAIAGTKISPDFGSQNTTTTGTSTAASFIPTSSTAPTNGVYLPSANNVAISTNGTGRLFVDASGNVGVGASASTASRLEVSRLGGAWTGSSVVAGTALTLHPGTGSTGSPANLTIFAGTTSSSSIYFGDTDSSSIGLIDYIHTSDAFRFNTNGSEKLRITSDGKVGLGTSSPSTTNGGLDIASGGLGLIIGADGSLSSRTNAANKQARIGAYHYTNSEEPVGIATVFSTASSNAVYFGGGTSFLNAATALEFYTAANTTTTTGTQRMVINSAGNVGIGTTSPADLLHSNGNIRVTWGANRVATVFDNSFRQGMAFDATNRQLQIFSTTSDTGGSIGFYTRNTAGSSDTDYGTEKARIDSSGRLLVGTTSYSGNATIVAQGHSGASTGPAHLLLKTGTTSPTSGGDLGYLFFSDANTSGGFGAWILGQRDGGTWTSGSSMPGRLVFSTTADGASSPTERMRISSNGAITGNANFANDYSFTTNNDGNNSNRYGLRVRCGTYDATGTNYAVSIEDGNGDNQGYITFTSGTVTYGAFTAHHPCILPEADNAAGYPYGTLLEIINIEYTQKDGKDTERGILYNVRKTQAANSRAVLGAYGSSMNGGPGGETNRHQALVLGDGHILCNNSGGNIKVGDGICSSATPGIGQKATATPSMAIGIAQEDVTFADGEEVKLVAVQYGVRQFIPWGD